MILSPAPETHGVFRSRTFPGLWLDVPALLAMQSAKVLDCLDRGVAAEEHAAFATRLKK